MNLTSIKENLFPKNLTPEQSRNKKMMILMPVLILVFIFVITRALKQPASCSANANMPAHSSSDSNSLAKINWQIPQAYPSNLRDPMQPASRPGADSNDAGGSIIIKGIIYSHDKPAAVINNEITHQGDIVCGATVKKISRKNVEFEANGKTWTQEVQE